MTKQEANKLEAKKTYHANLTAIEASAKAIIAQLKATRELAEQTGGVNWAHVGTTAWIKQQLQEIETSLSL